MIRTQQIKTILLVEDEIITAMVTTQLVQSFGFDVITAESGEIASEMASTNEKIDLILMDVDLGSGIDGPETARRILAKRNVPIVFLTSHYEKEFVESVKEITRYGYVIKNSGNFVLRSSIEMALELFEANREIGRELFERKRSEEKLRSSEVRYRRLFETAKDGILILDTETGMIVDVNPFLVQLLGYSYDMFMGKTIWDIGFLRDIIENKDKFMLLQEKEYVRYEGLPLETACGRVIEVEFVSNVYEADQKKVIQCNIRDMTEHKRVKDELSRSREQLKIVVTNLQGICFSFDNEGVFTFSDGRALSMLGLKPGQVVGTSVFDFYKDEPEVIAGIRTALSGITWTGNTFFKGIVFDNIITPIFDARQKVIGATGIAADITEREHAGKKINALLEEKQLILREVHHRIKNNMNTVAGLMYLQMDTLKEPAAVAALKDARSRVISMMVLYDKLYRSDDFNELSFREYIYPLVDEIVGNFPNKAIVKVEKNIDDFIIDSKRLSHLGIIINEIITNIMKYAFTGRTDGTITISAMAIHDRVIISIKDDGIGIPDSVDISAAAGFGLQLVDMMTRQLHGVMKFEHGGGTRFILEFNL